MKEKTKNHPYCRVLYKTDNTPGWYVAYLNGTEQQIHNPQKPTYTATKFEVNYVIDDESYDIAEFCNTFTISTEKEKYSLEFLYSDYECKKWFESFLQDIEEDRFTYFTVEEYWYTDIISEKYTHVECFGHCNRHRCQPPF